MPGVRVASSPTSPVWARASLAMSAVTPSLLRLPSVRRSARPVRRARSSVSPDSRCAWHARRAHTRRPTALRSVRTAPPVPTPLRLDALRVSRVRSAPSSRRPPPSSACRVRSVHRRRRTDRPCALRVPPASSRTRPASRRARRVHSVLTTSSPANRSVSRAPAADSRMSPAWRSVRRAPPAPMWCDRPARLARPNASRAMSVNTRRLQAPRPVRPVRLVPSCRRWALPSA